jgi:hypothetical protein
LAFLKLQGTYSGPPAILDPDFTLWSGSGNSSQLVVWNLEASRLAPTDYSLDRANIQGRDGLRLSLLQAGAESRLAYLRLSEFLDGQRLGVLMHSTIGFWIFKQPCNCDSNPFDATAVLTALETNDGIHSLSFVFTDHLQGTETLLGHRVVFIPTVSNQWVYEIVDIGGEYENAEWSLPGSLTFSLVFSVGGANVGWHTTCFSQIETYRSPSQLGLVSVDVALQTHFERLS